MGFLADGAVRFFASQGDATGWIDAHPLNFVASQAFNLGFLESEFVKLGLEVDIVEDL